MILDEWRGTTFIGECRVFWRVLDYCICLEETALMWFEVILMWFEFDLAPCLLLTLCMREESALGMRDVLSGKCCLFCLLWMLWRESAFELCAFGGKWLSNLLLNYVGEMRAGCAFWSDVWCLLPFCLAPFEMMLDAFCRCCLMVMESCRVPHAEMALLGISLTLGFGFVRPFCCFALGILTVDFCFLDAPLNWLLFWIWCWMVMPWWKLQRSCSFFFILSLPWNCGPMRFMNEVAREFWQE